VSPDDGAVKNKRLHIRVIGEMVMHLCEDASIAPPGKTLVDGVPFPIDFRQKSPLGTATSDPEDGFNEATSFIFVANIEIGATQEELVYFLPLVIW